MHGKRDFHEILKKARVEPSLGSLGTHGIESWCLLEVLCLRYFCDLFALDLQLLSMSSVWPYHLVCGVILLLVFMVYFFLLHVLVFYVLRIFGIGWGKRNVNGA